MVIRYAYAMVVKHGSKGTLERYYESNLYAVKKLKEQNNAAFF